MHHNIDQTSQPLDLLRDPNRVTVSVSQAAQILGIAKSTAHAAYKATGYLAAGVLAACALSFGGLFFFGSTGWDEVSIWGAPWIALCLVTGINLCLMPIWALLEGCNQVSNIYLYRFLQSILTSIVAWLGIYFGAGLWIAFIMGTTTLLSTVAMVVRRYSRFIQQIMFEHPRLTRLDWKSDILPMQWRVSLSWLSGYFTFSLFVPVLFHYHGAVVAGQMGMTWAFISALTGVVSSWITPKAPVFGMLIAQHKFAELDQIFWRLTIVVALVATLGAFFIWLLIYGLVKFDIPFSQRMLSPFATGCFLVATIIHTAGLPMSTYLRAHKKEPLLMLSIVYGVFTGVVVVVLGRYYSVDVVAIGYLAVMVIVAPFNVIIWRNCRAKWHRFN